MKFQLLKHRKGKVCTRCTNKDDVKFVTSNGEYLCTRCLIEILKEE